MNTTELIIRLRSRRHSWNKEFWGTRYADGAEFMRGVLVGFAQAIEEVKRYRQDCREDLKRRKG